MIRTGCGNAFSAQIFTGNKTINMDGDIFLNGENLPDNINGLKEQVKDLKEQVKDLKEIVDILYYLPPSQGGPGYENAKTHFETNSQG